MLHCTLSIHYLNEAVLALSSGVRNLELAVEAHLQMVPFVGDDGPRALTVCWEVLWVVGGFDSASVRVNDPTTTYRKQQSSQGASR